MPINNDRMKNSKIFFSGNEKSGFNSKKDIYCHLEKLTSLFLSDEDPRFQKSYLLIRKLNLLIGSIYDK